MSPTNSASPPPSRQSFSDNSSLPLKTYADDSGPDGGSPNSPSASETADLQIFDHDSNPLSPAATWPRWRETRSKFRYQYHLERDLYGYLKHIDSDDLSIHLYNAHALKRRMCQGEWPGKCDTASQIRSKHRWWEKNEWAPHAKWTAWPLELKDVPLPSETWGKAGQWLPDGETDRLQSRSEKPSDELEALLETEALRTARASFSRDRTRPLRTAVPASCQGNSLCEGSTTSSGSEDMEDSTNSPGSFKSAATKTDVGDNDLEGVYSPIIGLDDQKIDKALFPAVQNVLQSFECLLLALHHSRRTNFVQAPSKRSGIGKDSGDGMSHAPSSGHQPADPEQGTSDKFSKRKLHPRDWSEVIGSALHAGWSPSIVNTALERCQVIFSEGMTIHQLEERDAMSRSTRDARMDGKTDILPSVEEHDPAEGLLTSSPPDLGWKCPEVSCTEKMRVFRSREQWLEHIEQAHGYRYDGLETIVPIESATTKCQGGFCCPHSDCERHEWPYPQRWRLNQHLERKHNQRPVSRRSASASSVGPSDLSFPPSDDELSGGVHVDGFLKPIKTRRGWRGSDRSSRSSSSSASSTYRKRARYNDN